MSPIKFCKFRKSPRSSSCSRSSGDRSSGSGAGAAVAAALNGVKTTKSAATTPDITRPQTPSRLIKQVKQLRELERQRDELKKEVMNLAEANYAREPEFVRDRARIREQASELARMVRHTESKYVEPIVLKLKDVEIKMAQDARRHEEQSEILAKRFLLGGDCNNNQDVSCIDGETSFATSVTNVSQNERGAGATTETSMLNELTYEQFIGNYIKLRKEASKKRLLADRLAKERTMLLSNITSLKSTNSRGNAPSPDE